MYLRLMINLEAVNWECYWRIFHNSQYFAQTDNSDKVAIFTLPANKVSSENSNAPMSPNIINYCETLFQIKRLDQIVVCSLLDWKCHMRDGAGRAVNLAG